MQNDVASVGGRNRALCSVTVVRRFSESKPITVAVTVTVVMEGRRKRPDSKTEWTEKTTEDGEERNDGV